MSLNAEDTKKNIKSKLGKKKNVIQTPVEPRMSAQPQDDDLGDEPEAQDENQLVGTLTQQIPQRVINPVQPKIADGSVLPFTGGRKISTSGGMQLAYIVINGQLHSLRPDEFEGLDQNDLESSMRGRRVLKHNPTNVHKIADGTLRSNEVGRPLFYVEEGKLIRTEITSIPTKVSLPKGEKTVKAVKASGPNIIYIDDHRYSKQKGDSHLYSLNASQFADVNDGRVPLDGHKLLKHMPTCVTKDVDGNYHSSEAERRPMYRFVAANNDDVLLDTIIPVDVADPSQPQNLEANELAVHYTDEGLNVADLVQE